MEQKKAQDFMKWVGHGYCIILISISRSTSFIDHFSHDPSSFTAFTLNMGGSRWRCYGKRCNCQCGLGTWFNRSHKSNVKQIPAVEKPRTCSQKFLFPDIFSIYFDQSSKSHHPTFFILFLDHSIHSEHW